MPLLCKMTKDFNTLNWTALISSDFHLLTMASFGIFNPISRRGVIIPSNVPNIDPNPRLMSMAKNMTLQKGPPGM